MTTSSKTDPPVSLESDPQVIKLLYDIIEIQSLLNKKLDEQTQTLLIAFIREIRVVNGLCGDILNKLNSSPENK